MKIRKALITKSVKDIEYLLHSEKVLVCSETYRILYNVLDRLKTAESGNAFTAKERAELIGSAMQLGSKEGTS